MRSPLLTFASAISVALLMPWSVAQESKAPAGAPASAATSNANTGATNAKNAPAAKSGARPSLTVTLVEAQARDVPISLAANGSVAAWQEAILGAEVNGLRLAEVRAQIGDVVKRGQVLAVFAAETVEAELAQVPATITDDAVLARKYFEEAVRLQPGEARFQGFLGSALLAEGAIHKDEKLKEDKVEG